MQPRDGTRQKKKLVNNAITLRIFVVNYDASLAYGVTPNHQLH